MKTKILSLVIAAAVLATVRGDAAVEVDPSCQASAQPTVHTGSTLNAFATTKNGVSYDNAKAQLQLTKQGAQFSGTVLGVAANIFSGCSADFDEDGWTDFVATGSTTYAYLKVFKNKTYENPEPVDWKNPALIRTPKFQELVQLEPANTTYTHAVMGCADVNGDSHQDIVYIRCNTSGDCASPVRSDVILGNGNGTFQAPYKFVATGNETKVGPLGWTSNSLAFADYNGDGKLDMVRGTNATTGGVLKVLLNDGAAQPKFDQEVTLVSNAGFGTRGVAAVAAADFTGDGIVDFVIGGPSTNKLRLYPGLLGGGLGAYQDLATAGYGGGATAILTGDFSLSGKKGILVGSDGLNGYTGGRVYHYESNGTATPFSGGIKQTVNTGSSDLDMGWAFDYDHDPDHTPDFVMADGNNSASYYLFANRTVEKYVACGTMSSGTLDIGALANTEMTVTTVRLGPTPAVTNPLDGTMSWEASNDDGASWHPALACADDPTKYCATLTSTNGSKIRWRASMCSNTAAPANTRTPYVSAVETTYTYVTAENHFRAGPVARDGVVYVGAFRMPGNVGHFYAMEDQTGTTLWDAGAKLDQTAAAARHVYTVAADGTRLDFTTANTGQPLQQALLAPDQATAQAVVSWFYSARFGIYAPLRVLGAIENSTPAVLSAPSMPYWYNYIATPQSERTAVDAYVTAYKTRPQLLFVGSRDGALHAFRTNPTNPTDPTNGTEAWAFLPLDVSQRLLADKTAGTSAAYVDGSPTLVSAKVNGAWRTVLVAGEANGGRSVFALDVTDTVTTNGVVGPTPLWQFQDANMGRTYSKPTVIRVSVGGTEKWLAVFASGTGFQTDVGDSVYAVDLTTGALVWRFDLNDTGTYVSTDITASETDDEAGTRIDGYIDRVFFADNKGRVWKLDPASYDAAAQTIMPVGSTLDVGLGKPALFSTRLTAGALGEDRAIAGTLTAATDASNKLVVYFGTGGTEDTPDTVQNGFYAAFADSGLIRSKLDFGTGILLGVKFYGGVVYNNGQLLFTNGRDFGQHGLCSSAAGNVVALDANTFQEQFTTPVTSKIVAPVYAQSGALYTVTLTGRLLASPFQGTPGVTTPGVSGGPYKEAKEWGKTDEPTSVVGWRQM